MIGSTRQVRVFAYAGPVDMRKGFEGLAAIVREHFKRDPLHGDFYLFTNRRLKRAKVLHWDGTGMCVYAKRLETRGRFACLWAGRDASEVELSMSELQLFLEGSELVGRVPLTPEAIRSPGLAVTSMVG